MRHFACVRYAQDGSVVNYRSFDPDKPATKATAIVKAKKLAAEFPGYYWDIVPAEEFEKINAPFVVIRGYSG